MQHKSYMDSTITWQAHTVMKVEQECVNSGFFPNGMRMTAKDISDSKEQIEACKRILDQHGIIYQEPIKGQLQLF